MWRAATVSGKTTEVFYFYGIDGKMIQSYAPTYPVYQGETYMALGTEEQGLYFAGRLVGRSSGLGSLEAVSTDGIGTARWDNSLNGLEAWFYPWEERGTVTADDRVKFATYRRDSESSLDYAGNRYYDNVTGRFIMADPYLANSGGPGNMSDPQSWNRYAYTRGDPVNRLDPWGTCDTSGDTATSVTVCASGDPVQTQSVGSGASGGVFYFSTSGFPQAHTGWDQSHESQVELVGIDNALYKASVDCLKEQVGNTISAALAAAAGLAGQNWVSTAGKFAGATSGTSLISQFLSDVLPQRIPVSLPTLTNAGIKFTPVLGRILGRWVPIVGHAIPAYDDKAFTDCVDSKIQAAAKEAAGRPVLHTHDFRISVFPAACVASGVRRRLWFRFKARRLARSRKGLGIVQFRDYFERSGVPINVADAVYGYLSALRWTRGLPICPSDKPPRVYGVEGEELLGWLQCRAQRNW